MRLSLDVDAIHHEIDSTDPELLGRWVVEIFARYPEVTPATQFRVQAWPSWIPDGIGRPGRSDWIVDSRILGQIIPIQSPRELVEALGKQLDQLEALNG